MQFVDKARIVIKAGDGGDGCASFHREKFVTRGGPDGGDGGRGGNVVFVADSNMDTLLDFKFARFYRAENGEKGELVKTIELTVAGADRVLTMDLHAAQIQGFFDIPVDNLYGAPLFATHYLRRFGYGREDMVVVSPDVGSVARARSFAMKMGLGLAIVDKRREKANCSEVMNIIGNVEGKTCLLLDDMVDTAGSLCGAAKAIVEVGGAKEVYACASHGVLSGPAIDRINDSVIDELLLLDSIPYPKDKPACDKIHYLPVAPMFAEAINRIYEEMSISSLFE